MTEYTNNNKFVPQAQTYEVKYVEQQEQQKPKLSLAARQKIIQKHGSHYQSERLNEINPGYGPMPQSSETEKFSFSYNFQTGSRVHNYLFEKNEGKDRKYFNTLGCKGIGNGRDYLSKLESGDIRVVDKRKDKEEINFESGKTEDVKKTLRDAIKEYEEKGEHNNAYFSHYNA